MKLRYPVPANRAHVEPLCDLEDCSVYYDPLDRARPWLFVWEYTSVWVPDDYELWFTSTMPTQFSQPITRDTINHVRALTNLLYP